MTRKFEIENNMVSLNITEGVTKIKVSVIIDDIKTICYFTKRIINNDFLLHKEVFSLMRNLSNKWRIFDTPNFKAKIHEEILDISNEYALRLAE
jgi:hypothetical protein